MEQLTEIESVESMIDQARKRADTYKEAISTDRGNESFFYSKALNKYYLILIEKPEDKSAFNNLSEIIELCTQKGIHIYEHAVRQKNEDQMKQALDFFKCVLNVRPHHLTALTYQSEIIKFYINSARELCNEVTDEDTGKLEHILTLLKYVLTENPEHAEANEISLGVRQYILGKSRDLYSQVIDLQTQGKKESAYDKLIKAQALYQIIILKGFDDEEAYFYLGKIYHYFRKYGIALASFDKVLERNNRFAIYAEAGKALVFLSMGNFNMALSSFRRVIQIEPIGADCRVCDGIKTYAHFKMGKIMSQSPKNNHLVDAIEHFNRALQLDPLNSEIKAQRKLTLIRSLERFFNNKKQRETAVSVIKSENDAGYMNSF